MKKLSVSIVCIVIGFAVGVVFGYHYFEQPARESHTPEVRSFYYLLNDSTIVRHSIRAIDGSVEHSVGTIPLLPRNL